MALPHLLAQPGISLSPRAKISLITGSPGSDLYALFGHSAIRVQDPAIRLDILYNYGTFDFNTPNFYIKFAGGRLEYFLSIAYYQSFVDFYARVNRSVYEQELNLSPAQKDAVFIYLQNNYKPENKFYLYNFQYDNCSTRIRDVLDSALNGQVKFNENFPEKRKTYRDLLDPYLYNSWINLGLNLLLGTELDKKANYAGYMFLPEQMMDAFDQAQIQENNLWNPLVKEKRVVHQAMVSRPHDVLITPYLIFGLIFIFLAFVTWQGFKRKIHRKWIDGILFLIIGLVGTFFLTLWLISAHVAVKNNFNILWAFPLNAIFAILLFMGRPRTWIKNYALFQAFLQGSLLLTWPFLPQELHLSLIPLVLILLIRSLYIYFNFAKPS